MGRRLEILFLEDDPVLVEWVGLQLTASAIDASIDHVEDRAAFSARLDHAYDLYLLDYHLPDFDGLQALEQAQRRWPDVPKIMVSGTLDEESIIATMRRGATDYVLKSNMKRLIPAIRRALDDNEKLSRQQSTATELDDSRARFDDIAENIPGGVYQYIRRPDGSHSLPYVSPGFEQLMGVSQSEVEEDADKAFAGLLPADRGRFLDSLARSARDLSPWQQEFRVVRKGGHTLWMQGRATPHRRDDGSVLWNGIMLDVSREKQVASELEYQRVLFESAFRDVPSGMLLTSPDRTILMCNPAALKIFGYKVEELIGRNTEILYPDKESYQRVGARRVSVQRRGVDEAEALQLNFRRSDGLTFAGETIGTPILDKSGHVVAYVSVVRDISERVQADAEKEGLRQELENQVVERTRELQASEAQLRTTLDTVVDAIITIDEHGCIVMYNNAAERIFGYTEEETVGHNISMLMPAPYAGEHDDYLRNYRRTGHAKILGIGREVTGRCKSGRTFPMDLAVSEMRIAGQRMFTGVVRDISERKQAREALRASENRLQFLVQQSPAVIYTCAAGGGFATTFVSQNIRELMGFDPEQFVGNADFWFANIHPEDAPGVFAKRQGMFEKGHLFYEYRFRMPNGEYHWLHDELRLIHDEHGNPHEFIGYWIDIDDKKRAERELLEGGERLRRSQIYANIGTWEWNIRDGRMFWSERVGPLFGYPSGEFVASYEEFLDTIYSGDRQAVIEAVNACVELSADFDIEHRVLMSDGSIRWMLERGDVVRDRDGVPSRMLGVVQDITARKEFEERLKEAQRIGHIGHWSWDARSGEVLWSEEIYRIFDLRPGSIKPSPAGFMRFVDRRDRATLKRYVRKVFAGHGESGIDHRVRLRDGGERWIHVEVVTHSDEYGRPLNLSGTLQDITDRKRAETDLVRAKETAEKASKAKSEFLSNMSHELRTPLNAILGFSQLLRIDGDFDREQGESLAMIEQAGNHLLSLINEVLDLARIESGRMELEIGDVELDPLLDDCRTLIAPLADAHAIQLDLPEASEFVLRGDSTRVKQVLLNLLSNAVKYNRRNGSVSLRCEDMQPGMLRISVTDTGPGIETSRLGELFSAFNRLGKERGQIEGTGIGLVIAKNLIELMGGQIGVESAPGMGSTFWITIPLSAALRETRVAPAVGGTSSGLAGLADDSLRSILYIEDNAANLRLVGHLFKKRGNVDLLTSETSQEGIQLARERRPDLILLDINLPDMDGFEVLRVLRADPQTADIPVLAVSANAMPADLQKGHSAGFDDYITKPIDVKKFFATVDAVFNQSEAHPASRRRSAPAA